MSWISNSSFRLIDLYIAGVSKVEYTLYQNVRIWGSKKTESRIQAKKTTFSTKYILKKKVQYLFYNNAIAIRELFALMFDVSLLTYTKQAPEMSLSNCPFGSLIRREPSKCFLVDKKLGCRRCGNIVFISWSGITLCNTQRFRVQCCERKSDDGKTMSRFENTLDAMNKCSRYRKLHRKWLSEKRNKKMTCSARKVRCWHINPLYTEILYVFNTS